MRKNSIQKFLIATNRLITLLSMWFGLFAFSARAIASPNAAAAAPTQITFTILNTCGSGDTYQFILNGTAIGSLAANTSGQCTCTPALQTITVNNTNLLTGAWNSSGQNALRVVKNGGSTYFAWVSAQLTFSSGSSKAYYDYKGGDATQTNLCSAEYSNSPFDQVLVTSTVFYRDADDDGFGDPNNIISDYSPSPGAPPAGYVTKSGDCDDSDPTIPSQTPCLAKPFNNTAGGLGFTQELVASLPDGNPTSGYGFDSHGNPYTYSWSGNLMKIDLSTTIPGPGGVGTVHPLVNLGPIKYRTGSRSGQTVGTCYNFTQYPDGTVYVNSDLGVVQVNLETATATSEPLPGNAWGIVVDPQLNAHGHHNIITAGGRVIDPVDHRDLGSCGISGDGIAIDATGNFIFAASGFQIYKRVSSPGTDLPVFQSIGNYGGSPDGMAFGVVGTDQVVVSNDGGAGTVTMWKFPNNDFTQRPTPTIIASDPVSGEYGDQANVGPDGYFYITYWYGTRFPDGSTTRNTSVVRFGPAGRFLPPTHSDNISLTPATDTKTVGSSDDLTATLVTTDLSTNQTVPLANTSVTFTVAGGPDLGQTFTGTTDADGNVTFTLVNQNGEGDDVVHAQFVDGNGNTQTSNNSVITFVKPACTAPVFTTCIGNQTANTLANSCDNTVTYSSSESVTGTAPTITYEFTGATTGSGTGNGSGSLFNKGTTTVTLTATNSCGSATCTFTVTVTDNQPPIITTNGNISVSNDLNVCGAAVTVSASATDNCSVGAPTGIRSDGLALDAVYPVGITTITWNVTDANDNAALPVTQTVTVKDVEKPNVHTKNITVQLDATGHGSITDNQVDNGSTDNCTAAASLQFSTDIKSFDCSNVGHPVTVTLTVTDGNGNSDSKTATVTVEDHVKPNVLTKNITVQLNVSGHASITDNQVDNGSTDNCTAAASLQFSTDIKSFDCSNVGHPVMVTLTVTDGNGNSDSKTATVTVEDHVKPNVLTKNITVQLDVSGHASITDNQVDNGSTDNCTAAANLQYSTDIKSFDCSNVGHPVTVTLTVTDANGNFDSKIATVTVEDHVKPTVVCKSIQVYLGLNGTVTIIPQQVDGGSSDACGISLSLDKTTFSSTNLGANTVTLTGTDPSGNYSSCQATVTVLKRPTTLVYTGDGSEQYSDQQVLTAELRDQLTNTLLSNKLVSFNLGSQSASATTNGSGVASINLIINQDPAPVYTVKSNFAGDATFLPSSDEDAFDILQEDARAYYSGALMASTSGVNTSTATVTLSATIKDITAVSGDPAYDAFKGDIRNATVTFINRDNNTVLASNVPVGLVNLSDLTVGTATKNVTLDIGSADAKQFTIGIIVNNYYTCNSSADNTIVTVSKPLDNFVTGGGYIVLTDKSAGQKAGTQGTNNNFGFNLKYNKNGTNLQGNINTIIRRMETDGMHVYQIKGNSMTSLAVNSSVSTAKTATFNGKASIQDITDPFVAKSVEGNATLQVTMTDRGEPGNTDDIAITVWNKSGGLWYSSNWNGTTTVNQTLAGGNLKVNGGSYNATSTSTVTLKLVPEQLSVVPANLTLTVLPNPAPHAFTLSLKSNLKQQKIEVRVLDALGRVIEIKNNLTDGETFRLGENYRPGTYLIQATQGDQKEIVKVIKL